MADRGGEFSLFQGTHARTDEKNWYFHFYRAYDHQIWQAGTSIGFDLNETNQAGADYVKITWQIKFFLSLLTYFPWPPNSAEW